MKRRIYYGNALREFRRACWSKSNNPQSVTGWVLVAYSVTKKIKEYARAGDVCKRVGKPSRRDELPLNPVKGIAALEMGCLLC